VTCPACAAELPSAFPGASIVCVCGHRVELPGPRPSAALPASTPRAPSVPPSLRGDGPYRSGGGVHEAAVLVTPCPYCGNDCPPMVRICPHCDVRFDSVRCQRCFSLQAPGAFSCARCAHPLELEPLLDATDAPCPRCTHPLEVSPAEDTRLHECPRCGGMFVPRALLAEILCNAELGGGLRESAPRLGLDEVRYVPCPLCHSTMNRVNFGRVSGVIVDVCKMHGTWFDAGELTRVVAFAASGGLEKTRERERVDKRDERQRANEVHAQLAIMEAKQDAHGRLTMWQDFLRTVFSW
jgi:Zn-finger nucleic acid-binding protein